MSTPAPLPSSTPSAPPVAPVALTALLALDSLGLRQIAGPDAREAGTVVHWAHTSELSDPSPYLLGGELLLTAGVHIGEAGDGDLDAYVARVVAAGCAALGFGVAPVHDTVPRALEEACDRHGLPLLEVPPRTTFSGVARAVWRLMAEARHAELRRVAEAQQGLATAAARPDPVPAVLRQLATRLNGAAFLYGPEGTELQSAGRTGGAARAALRELTAVVRRATPGAPTAAADTAGPVHLTAYALGGGRGFALGVATEHRAAGDHTITGAAVVLLSLLAGEHQSASEAARSAALVRLLLGAEPERAGALLGSEAWRVVHARVAPSRAERTPPSASALAVSLGTPLVDPAEDDPDSGVVRLLVPADRELDPPPGWTLGVSAPAPVADLVAADARAARALRRAEVTRSPLVRDRESGFAALVEPAEAAAHARVLLDPVASNPALVETLRTWLSLHGSWDRTATALGVHRNTVRQRIGRCAALLETDLDDPDVRMELWFALRNC
ncbi:PucR family transcriptional regulator [Streptomyces cavernicola]|uniref:PucR family transcriptional regulator n=1 Tax=Streptomyces cavernicola TaxID=3043613 RepID=A0ABT6S8W1_9ACTN|nr:PucR family transcriptional regulator [Streptomyces sp. B-S-A6]MDI3404319.1 PucR family transcriptional regulator [Streptomyces sp. B-S-A6]